MARQDVKDNKLAGSGSQREVLRCFACDGRGYKAVDCPSRVSTCRNKLKSCFRRSYCYKCGLKVHYHTECRNSSPRTQPKQRLGGRSTSGSSTQNRQIASAMQVSRGQKRRRLKKEWILWS